MKAHSLHSFTYLQALYVCYAALTSPTARYCYRKLFQLLGIFWAVLVYLFLCLRLFVESIIEGYTEPTQELPSSPVPLLPAAKDTQEAVEDLWTLPAIATTTPDWSLEAFQQEARKLALTYGEASPKPIGLLPPAQAEVTPTKRRGRPKGSKNRPKVTR